MKSHTSMNRIYRYIETNATQVNVANDAKAAIKGQQFMDGQGETNK
jgi:hypothetical protein